MDYLFNNDAAEIFLNSQNLQQSFQYFHRYTYPISDCLEFAAAFFYVSFQTGTILRIMKNYRQSRKNKDKSKDVEKGDEMENIQLY